MRKQAWIRLVLLLLLGLPFPPLRASELSRYSSRLWQVEEGLPHNMVQAVAQTRDGYLWVGTADGLARFDGVRFQKIDVPGLVHASISALCETSDGDLWIAAETGVFRLSEGSPTHFTGADGLPESPIQMIQEDADGDLIVASRYGAFKLSEGRFVRHFEEDLKGERVWAIWADSEGGLWSAGSSLKYMSEERAFTATGGLIGGLRSVCPGRDGGVWIGSVNGLSYWRNGQFSNYPKGSGPSAFVNAIYEGHDGTVWIGTYEGLSRFVDGEFFDESNEDGASYWVHCIVEDREGNLWVGSDEGLTRLSPQRFLTYNKRDGLSHNWTKAVCASADGSIWVAVWGGGLYRFEDGKPSLYSADLSSQFVYSMHEARDGSLWLGMDYSGGINLVKDGRTIRYGREDGLRTGLISAIYEDHAGNVWVGSNNGLHLFEDERFTRYGTEEGLSHNRVNVIGERWDGTLLVGTDDGMSEWQEGLSVDERLLGSAVLAVYEDDDRVLWIGTQGEGLKRISDGKFYSFTTREGLSSDTIYAILEDDRGLLWMHGGRGIFRVSREELNAVAAEKRDAVTAIEFGRADGIVSSGQYRYASQPAAAKGADGRLWFRTPQGVVVVDPSEITTNEVPPPIIIEQVVADKERKAFRVPGSGLRVGEMDHGTENVERDTQNPELKTLTLPPGRGELEIHFTALSFMAPEKNRFKFKLEGVDRDWVDAGNRRVAYYNSLRPGSYTFRVKAANNDGVWNETDARLGIVWQPNFWQTWWFSGLLVACAAGAVAGLLRYLSTRRLQRALAVVEGERAVEKERGRIARDMHDDLGARLSEILVLSNLPGKQSAATSGPAVHLKRISVAARDLVDNLDAIVWAVNPRHDSLESFVTYAQEYVSNYMEAHAARCEFEIPIELPEVTLASQTRHDLFLVVKEAIHNLVKHSQATKVRFAFQCEATYLSLEIGDNGVGFSAAGVSGFGNGLGNMEQRMRRTGGQFDLTSEPGQGVRIRLTVPIGH